MPKKKYTHNKTILVLGLPRSGTSLTCGILNNLGIKVLGDKAPTFINPSGTFEDLDLVKLDYEIIRSTGDHSYWTDPPKRSAVLAKRSYFSKKLNKLLKRKIEKNKSAAFKHPPNSLTIELYLAHLRNPHIIFVKRNMKDVVKSCKTAFPELKNYKESELENILKSHQERIINLIKDYPSIPSITISYENILINPRKQAEKISDFLGIELSYEMNDNIDKLVIPKNRLKYNKLKAKIRRSISILNSYISEVWQILNLRDRKHSDKLLKVKILTGKYYQIHLKKNRLYKTVQK